MHVRSTPNYGSQSLECLLSGDERTWISLRLTSLRSQERTYIITVKRMISGEVLKCRNGFLIHGGYGARLTGASWFPLTLTAYMEAS